MFYKMWISHRAAYDKALAAAAYDDTERDHEHTDDKEKYAVPAVRKAEERQNGDERTRKHDQRIDRHATIIPLLFILYDDHEFPALRLSLCQTFGEFLGRTDEQFLMNLGEFPTDIYTRHLVGPEFGEQFLYTMW